MLINDGRILFNGSPDDLLHTDLLAANGIREPLYLTTLCQLGFRERCYTVGNFRSDRRSSIQLLGELVFGSITTGARLLPELKNVQFAYGEKSLKDIHLAP